ncbi:hypothetical protein ACQPZA_35925 [Pseudonocardia xinjiangensis]|uniref:hypothetical protein n=1 Tax=Pseudonocardia xinjiangensis TaxID=75289 RepID=UPI003D8D76B8
MTAKARTIQNQPEDVRPGRPAEGRFEGHRSATVNLPFVTAQFRVPDLHAPSRGDLDAAARGARSMLPSTKSMLFFGGLAATAVVGVLEWPVAAAIGIGSALASRGSADPRPRAALPPAQAETTGSTTTPGSPPQAGKAQN